MRRFALLGFVLLCSFSPKSDINTDPKDAKNLPGLLSNNVASPQALHLVDSLYDGLHLDEAGLAKQAFLNAYKGYEYLLSKNKLVNKDVLTICDYSQASNKRRLYVIDLKNNRLLFNTYVAHGHNSGADMATSFSNSNSSNKSSLGFLVTAETYFGHNGYSLRLDGMEKGINDNVRARAVVMHGSDYVGDNRVKAGVMMGRSWGCPAVPRAECVTIIDKIKGGSCIYLYNPDAVYTRSSPILNAKFDWPSITPLIAGIQMPNEVAVAAQQQ